MRSILLVLVALSLSFSSSAQVLISNTTVVDVENKKLLPAQNVLIKNGVITAIGGKVSAPKGTQVIDGSGKFLVPGFVDTHVHFFQSGGLYTRPDVVDLRKYRPYAEEITWTHNNMEKTLRRYTSAGITTVVDVGSTINFLKQRDTFRNKDYAPAVYMAGPLFTTWESPVYKGLEHDEPFYEMKTVEGTRRNVHEQIPFKPDFVKIAYLVRGSKKDSVARSFLPLVSAAIDEAHKLGLRVAVHAFQRITAQLAVEAGANHLVHVPFDEPIEAAFIQLLKDKKVVVSSSTTVFEGYHKTFGQYYEPSPYDTRYADPAPLASLQDLKNLPDTALTENLKSTTKENAASDKKNDEVLRKNLLKLVEGGIPVATATDAGNIGTQHVSSYFAELLRMQQSGMNTWQLIQSSTINGAMAVGKQTEFGSIRVGKRADMVLLSKNPIDNLENWQAIDWVINKGVPWKPDKVSLK